MMEFMTIDEMRTRFPAEWLLIGDPQMDDKQRLVAGIVLWHSEDRREVHEKATKLRSRLVAVRCFLESPEDEVVYCLSPLVIEAIHELEVDRLEQALPKHVDELRRLMHLTPFQPFIIHMGYRHSSACSMAIPSPFRRSAARQSFIKTTVAMISSTSPL